MSPVIFGGVVFVVGALAFVAGAAWEGTRAGGSRDAWDAATGRVR